MSTEYKGPARLAHRGLMQKAPENTLAACQAASDAGVEGVEIDVRLSRDGQVVVVHDENLTRLTLGHPTKFTNGRIAEMTWDELAQVELPYANHLLDDDPPSGSDNEFLAILPYRMLGQEEGRSYKEALERDGRMAGLMLFSDFLKWLKGVELFAEIEVKASGMAEPLFQLLDGSPVAERCILFSGVRSYVSEMQHLAAKQGKPAGVRLGANIRALTSETKQYIKGMDLYEVGLNDRHITQEDIIWLRSHGIEVFGNLGDYPQWWETLRHLDIAGFKTNYAVSFSRWWGTATTALPKDT